MSKKKKILIAEGEKPIANALKIKFQSFGIEVVNVFNGKDVFQELKKNDFDLILLDLMMPEMSGFEVLDKIKEKGIKTPVVVISNLGQEADIKRCLEAGALEYIVKSNTSIVEIVKRVEEIISKLQHENQQ